ncbi:MAG TPA: c-type cytochrome [Parachlamydiaceae bacterium]|nr:c-type cytochrome [Parachlamydiaceae bacterium]
MSGSSHPLVKLLALLLTVLGLASFIYLLIYSGNSGNVNPTQIYIERKLTNEEEAKKLLQFNLVDHNRAPEPIQEMAKLGFQAMVDTKKIAPDYVGSQLSCTNCHFAGGNTTGGSSGGISLAGVATKYPNFDSYLNKIIDLPTRINNCFMKSMNGKALPLDSELMLAFVTYFQWISKNLPIYGDVPWLGLKILKSQHVGNPLQGQKIFNTYCALCHKEESRGKIYPPPLWGNESSNDAAGMSHIPKLAAFIYWNMPYNDDPPVLSEEEAIDVASYILSKPRPHFDPTTQQK